MPVFERCSLAAADLRDEKLRVSVNLKQRMPVFVRKAILVSDFRFSAMFTTIPHPEPDKVTEVKLPQFQQKTSYFNSKKQIIDLPDRASSGRGAAIQFSGVHKHVRGGCPSPHGETVLAAATPNGNAASISERAGLRKRGEY